MGKRSREKKQRKIQQRVPPRPARPIAPAQGASPVKQIVGDRILQGGKDYFETSFIRILHDSYTLRDEPEFRDLEFDLDETNRVNVRAADKYESQFSEIRKKSEDERHTFYDDVRIEMIDELATPAFRQDVLGRLKRLEQRLTNVDEADKLEMALVLKSTLQGTEIPWGLCGLVTAIYEDSAEKANAKVGHELAEIRGIVRGAGWDDKLERFLTAPDDSPEVRQVADRLQAVPGLMKHLEKKTDREFREFERSIADGTVPLDLFTAEELARPFAALAKSFSAQGIAPEAADPAEVQNRLAEFIRRTMREVVTKDRTEKMKAALQQVFSEWMRAKKWQAALIQGEIAWLDSVKPSENPFLYATFVGQLKRRRNARPDASRVDASETVTPSEAPSAARRDTN